MLRNLKRTRTAYPKTSALIPRLATCGATKQRAYLRWPRQEAGLSIHLRPGLPRTTKVEGRTALLGSSGAAGAPINTNSNRPAGTYDRPWGGQTRSIRHEFSQVTPLACPGGDGPQTHSMIWKSVSPPSGSTTIQAGLPGSTLVTIWAIAGPRSRVLTTCRFT